MKIEICEQMVQSWLQNIKGCQIVQTNWSVSPLFTIDTQTLDIVKKFQSDIESVLKETTDNLLENLSDIDVFKQSKPAQFIKQCEIDVVGIQLENGIAQQLYLVDSAFHSTYGLGYKNPEANVIKKILRAILISFIIFKDIPANIYFVSPLCKKQLHNNIQSILSILNSVIYKYFPDVKVEVLFNDKFSTEIYKPLVDNIGKLNNDNDLFMRSLSLAKIAQNNLPTTNSQIVNPPVGITGTTHKTPKGSNKTTVFKIFNDIVKNGKMTPALLHDLQTPEFAKVNFNMPTFPILVKTVDFNKSGYQPSRYYKDEFISINGETYLLCSQWIPARIRLLKYWFDKL